METRHDQSLEKVSELDLDAGSEAANKTQENSDTNPPSKRKLPNSEDPNTKKQKQDEANKTAEIKITAGQVRESSAKILRLTRDEMKLQDLTISNWVDAAKKIGLKKKSGGGATKDDVHVYLNKNFPANSKIQLYDFLNNKPDGQTIRHSLLAHCPNDLKVFEEFRSFNLTAKYPNSMPMDEVKTKINCVNQADSQRTSTYELQNAKEPTHGVDQPVPIMEANTSVMRPNTINHTVDYPKSADMPAVKPAQMSNVDFFLNLDPETTQENLVKETLYGTIPAQLFYQNPKKSSKPDEKKDLFGPAKQLPK